MTSKYINDRKLRALGIPALALVISLCFNLFYTLEFGIPLWKVLLSNLVYVAFVVELTRLIVLYGNRLFSGAAQTRKRVSIILGGLVLLSPLLGAGHIFFEKDVLFRNNEDQNLYSYLSASGSTFFFSLIIAAVYEAWYFFQAWRSAAQEKETFEKASMEAQYELLKSQVQPHFLFNSLNSLISLVDEDSRRAKKFIKELSFVYRYLLQSNMHTLVTIKEEMAFISAYQFLLQTRFEEGLKVLIDIEDNVQNKLLPPLTVQILLENAVKHNRAEKDHPLCVDIKARGDLLLVQNNIQRKPEPVYSSKLGLSNIIAKYASLRQQDNILVEERDSVFSVSLPLIPEASAAATAGKLQKEPL